MSTRPRPPVLVLSPLLPVGSRARRSGGAVMVVTTALALAGCGHDAVQLHAPSCPTVPPRTEIEIEPITTARDLEPVSPHGLEPAAPDGVLTSSMRAELAGRALEGGEPGGYAARCQLDRYALRFDTELTTGMATLYVDLACTVRRKADNAAVWRGELRGRAATAERKTSFPGADEMLQSFSDRLVSDASREMAADLAVRILGLRGKPAQRAFPNEDAERTSAGLDDGPLGPLALVPTEASARTAAESLRAADPEVRAAAWNALAMAASPDVPWLGGIETRFDDDAVVRFYQYKALARHATPATLSELKRAGKRETNDLLQEMVGDALSTAGLAVRAPASAASADTSGATTSP